MSFQRIKTVKRWWRGQRPADPPAADTHGVGLLGLAEVVGTDPAGKEVPFGAGRWLGLGPFAAAPWHETGSCGGEGGHWRGGLPLAGC